MELKKLGSTQVQVPEIGLGTWQYSGGIEPLRAGLDQGACLIDTAEVYGAEEVVGQAIQGRRQQVFIATKAAPRNFRRRDLIAAAENSLRRLGTDYVDLYQLHWPNYTVPIAETMAAMEELVDAGKVRFIGVSNFDLWDLKRAQAPMRKYKIVSNQMPYSLIERSIEGDMLDYCRQNEITVLAYSPLGNRFAAMRAADRNDVLSQVAKRVGKTEAQVALNWLIAKDHVVALVKASTVAHAIEDCGASGWRLAQSDSDLLETGIPCCRLRRGWARATLGRYRRYWAQLHGRGL